MLDEVCPKYHFCDVKTVIEPVSRSVKQIKKLLIDGSGKIAQKLCFQKQMLYLPGLAL